MKHWEGTQAKAVCIACFDGNLEAMAEYARRKLAGDPVPALGAVFRNIIGSRNRTEWWEKALRKIGALKSSERASKSSKGKRYRFPVFVHRGEDGLYVGIVPSLEGCHAQGRTLDQLHERVVEAITLCLEGGQEPPSPESFVGFHEIEVAV
jgi:predicted RNase H-like HicB family nuclease